jgi:hypothetical protein
MLRIPTSTDTPPPLIAAARREGEPPAADGKSRGSQSRRRKKAGGAENYSWEQVPKSSRTGGSEEKRQMRLMLVGGASLFAVIVVGVILLMNGGTKPVVRPVGEVAAPHGTVKNAEESPLPPAIRRSEASLLSEAGSLARKFLEATTVEELLPLVRNPAVAEARMRGFYPGGKIEAPGMMPLGAAGGFAVRDKLVSLVVRTRDFEEKSLAFIDTPQGLKIDWESWAGWSEISWKEFMATKPTSGHVFRVILAPVDYYNFEFTDDQKWQSYRLESPDHEHAVYGYAGKGTVLNGRLHPDKDTKSINLMLSLKFPAGTTSANQVEIERFVAEGWVEEADSP